MRLYSCPVMPTSPGGFPGQTSRTSGLAANAEEDTKTQTIGKMAGEIRFMRVLSRLVHEYAKVLGGAALFCLGPKAPALRPCRTFGALLNAHTIPALGDC